MLLRLRTKVNFADKIQFRSQAPAECMEAKDVCTHGFPPRQDTSPSGHSFFRTQSMARSFGNGVSGTDSKSAKALPSFVDESPARLCNKLLTSLVMAPATTEAIFPNNASKAIEGSRDRGIEGS